MFGIRINDTIYYFRLMLMGKIVHVLQEYHIPLSVRSETILDSLARQTPYCDCVNSGGRDHGQ